MDIILILFFTVGFVIPLGSLIWLYIQVGRTKPPKEDYTWQEKQPSDFIPYVRTDRSRTITKNYIYSYATPDYSPVVTLSGIGYSIDTSLNNETPVEPESLSFGGGSFGGRGATSDWDADTTSDSTCASVDD